MVVGNERAGAKARARVRQPQRFERGEWRTNASACYQVRGATNAPASANGAVSRLADRSFVRVLGASVGFGEGPGPHCTIGKIAEEGVLPPVHSPFHSQFFFAATFGNTHGSRLHEDDSAALDFGCFGKWAVCGEFCMIPFSLALFVVVVVGSVRAERSVYLGLVPKMMHCALKRLPFKR